MKLDKTDFKEQVRQQIELVKEKIQRFESMAAPITPDDAIGRVSRMDAINNKSVAEAALKQAKNKLFKLEEMLITVDQVPNFGNCRRCGKAIPTMRIILMPDSPYCVRCA